MGTGVALPVHHVSDLFKLSGVDSFGCGLWFIAMMVALAEGRSFDVFLANRILQFDSRGRTLQGWLDGCHGG